MINTIYIEDEIIDHPRSREILERFPDASIINCEHYGEIFNRKAQNFRLQKKQPALILARKHKNLVLDAPDAYGIGGKYNYYFSHMLNCLYDCRYCFLQGMYRSAHYVLFVNNEDFISAIKNKVDANPGVESYFFSGYDCDSLAFDPVTRFTDNFIPVFSNYPQAWLELRTKSTQIRSLLKMDPVSNCVVAYSFTPERISRAVEKGVPSLQRRLDAIVKLQQQGWKIGLRFDPLIYQQSYKSDYENLFKEIFNRVSIEKLHSVSLGAFRLPESYFRNVVRLYPDVRLFAGPLENNNGMISFHRSLETEIIHYCTDKLLGYIPAEILFPCVENVA